MAPLMRGETHRYHVVPFPGANMEPASMAVTGIDPHHPLRPAIQEEDALQRIFKEVRTAIRAADCTRAVLVGHNASFDLNFLNAAVARAQVKRNPSPPLLELRYGHARRDLLPSVKPCSCEQRSRPAWNATPRRRIRLVWTPSAPRICSASCAISSKACSTPDAGAWPRWDRSKSRSTPKSSLRRLQRPLRPAAVSIRRSCTFPVRCRSRRPARR